MYDLIKKIINAGLDVQDKVVDSLDELVSKGKIDPADREKFIKDLDKKLSETKDKGEDFINEVAKKVSIKNPFVAKDEITALEKKIEKLEKKINQMEGKKTTAKKTAAKKKPAKKENTPAATDNTAPDSEETS